MERPRSIGMTDVKENEVHCQNGEITLTGTWLLPDAKGPHPAINIVEDRAFFGRPQLDLENVALMGSLSAQIKGLLHDSPLPGPGSHTARLVFA